MATNLTDDPDFELDVLRTLLAEPLLLAAMAKPLQPQYLSDPSIAYAWSLAADYYETHKQAPPVQALRDKVMLAHAGAGQKDKLQRNTTLEAIAALYQPAETHRDYVVARLSTFLKAKAITAAVVETADELQGGLVDDDKVLERFMAATKVGDEKFSLGARVVGDTAEVIRRESDPAWRPATPTGLVHFDQELGGGVRPGELAILMAPPKGFKCHDGDDLVMMFNGSTKRVKDVRVGDRLMGDDGQPRLVLEVGTGRGPMYQVSGDSSYRVTAEHVLCLKRTDSSQLLELTAANYAQRDPGFQREWQGYRAHVNLPGIPLQSIATRVEPAGDGYWVGFRVDGNHRYLLADFTVTHNSGTMLNFAFNAVKIGVGVNVLYVTLELSEHLQLLRFGLRTTMRTKYQMLRDPEAFIQYWKLRVSNIYAPGANVYVKYFDPYRFTPQTLDRYIEQAKAEGVHFGLVIIDYLNLVGSDEKKDKDYLERVMIATDLRALGHKHGWPLWTAARATREEQSSRRPGMQHMGASYEWVGIADYVYALRRFHEEGTLHIIPVASRNEGGSRRVICRCDPSLMFINSVGTEDMRDDEEDETGDRPSRRRRREDDADGVEAAAREIRRERRRERAQVPDL